MRILLLSLLFFRVYAISISQQLAVKNLVFAKPQKEIPFTGFFRLKKQTKEFFHDLGAKYLDKENYGFSGIYIDKNAIFANSGKVFGKWKQLLKEPKNTKLLHLLEANLSSTNLRELFSFPKEVTFQKNVKNKTVLIFLDFTIPLTMQVREILNFSLRGFSILAVDFHNLETNNLLPCWEKCKKIADLSFQLVSNDTIIYGKSFGSALATYLASKHRHTSLILDRPFLSMKEVAQSIFFDQVIQDSYCFPTNKLIEKLHSHPLIITSSENQIFKNHGEKLLDIYLHSHNLKNFPLLKEKYWIHTKGGHYNAFLNNGKNSWFSYNGPQRKLNQFLIDLP